jgi:glyoxylase-like metal-dependent hydrolase (beta-lactamase superfamily II)
MTTSDQPAVQVLQLPLGPLQTNCYVLACNTTGEAVVIDPAWDGRGIAQTIADHGWRLRAVWLTHAHFDHVGGLAELHSAAPELPIAIHADALPMLRLAAHSAQAWGIGLEQPADPSEHLRGGQRLLLGDLEVTVLYTPGHAPGHVCFYLADHDLLFDGDVLFQQSIGRTDLPGGDFDVLMASIRDELLVLPDETVVLSGHGQATTIGEERRSNPFLVELR